MENEELTDDLEVEQEDENVEEEESPEENELETTTTLTVEQRLAKAEAEAAKFRRLFEKANKAPKPKATETVNQPSSVNVEETVLKAQGMPNELLTQLKKVASLEGISLIDAQKNDLFVAVKDKYEKAQTTKAASVGTSRGSGKVSVKKTVNTPGLSREEHKALVRG